ncbi:MAG: universal stress protein, partial [Candidatus Hydrothermarchaeales archaeon]
VSMKADIKVLYVREIPRSAHEKYVERAREKVIEWGLELPAVRELKRAEKILEKLGVVHETPSEEHVEELVFKESEKGGYSLHLSGTQGELDLKIRDGNPPEEIIREAEERGYNLLVMGGHKGPLDDYSVGNVTRQVAEYIKIPVWVVKEDVKLKRMLVCTDGSEQANEAIHCAAHIAKALGVKVVLLSVSHPVKAFEDSSTAELGEDMKERLKKKIREFPIPEKKYLDEGKRLFKQIGIEAGTKLVDGDAVKEILREASEGKYDLIVTGSRGFSGLKRLIMGRVSLNVLEKAEANVLIVRNCIFYKKWMLKKYNGKKV